MEPTNVTDLDADENWICRSMPMWAWAPKPPDSDPGHPNHPVYMLRRLLRHTALAHAGKRKFACRHAQTSLYATGGYYQLLVQFGGRSFVASAPTIDEVVQAMARKIARKIPEFKKEMRAERRRQERGEAPGALLVDGPDAMW
jgi:hypothetical protein